MFLKNNFYDIYLCLNFNIQSNDKGEFFIKMRLKWWCKYIIDCLLSDCNSLLKIFISKYLQVYKMQYNCFILNGNFQIFKMYVSEQKCYYKKCIIFVIYVLKFFF